jgi:hypothetical protein
MGGVFDGFVEAASPAIKEAWHGLVGLGVALKELLFEFPLLKSAWQWVAGIAGAALSGMIAKAKALQEWLSALLQPVIDVSGESRKMGVVVGSVIGQLVGGLVSLPGKFLSVCGCLGNQVTLPRVPWVW